MNELTLDNKIYVSSKRAAELTGYAKDYVGQLCREGRVEARLVGRNWYVLKDAIKDRKFEPLEASEAATTEEKEEITPSVTESLYADLTPSKYESEIYQVIPSVNRLSEPEEVKEIPINIIQDSSAPDSTMERLNDAWSTWFSKKEDENEQESTEVDQKNENIESEKVTLRRIREYKTSTPTTMDIQAPVFEQKSDTRRKRSSKAQKFAFNRVLMSGFLVIVAAFAILIGYAGSRFYNPSQSVPKEVNSIAGADFYTKGQ